MTKLTAILTAAGLAGVLCACAAPSSDAVLAGSTGKTIVPFRLLNNHIYADVKIDGKGPYSFIFDTGGFDTVTPALAQMLGLAVTGHTEAQGAGAGTMPAGHTKITRLDIGAASFTHLGFDVLPLDALSDVEGVSEFGMIGSQTFARFVTRIDYGAKTITLIDPKGFDPNQAGVAVPIALRENVPLAEGSYDGFTARFLIDTGARMPLSLNTPFVASHGLRADAPNAVETTTGWGIGGPTHAFAIRGEPLRIGTVTVASPVTLLSTDKAGVTAERNFAGIVGGGILKRFIVTFDYGHATMYLKPITAPLDDLDNFDRAGMWINADPAGFRITDVTAKTPAAEAGLAAGDVITAVDGKPAAGLDLSALRQRLRDDAPGTIVTFTVKRRAEANNVKVTLRDLI